MGFVRWNVHRVHRRPAREGHGRDSVRVSAVRDRVGAVSEVLRDELSTRNDTGSAAWFIFLGNRHVGWVWRVVYTYSVSSAQARRTHFSQFVQTIDTGFRYMGFRLSRDGLGCYTHPYDYNHRKHSVSRDVGWDVDRWKLVSHRWTLARVVRTLDVVNLCSLLIECGSAG